MDKELEEKTEEIMKKLSKLLDTPKDWYFNGTSYCHRVQNLWIRPLKFRLNLRAGPENIIVPGDWKKTIKAKLPAIKKEDRLKELSFIHDLVNEKYGMYIQFNYMTEDAKNWIEENDPEGYVKIGRHIYLEQALAMAYKLKWT